MLTATKSDWIRKAELQKLLDDTTLIKKPADLAIVACVFAIFSAIICYFGAKGSNQANSIFKDKFNISVNPQKYKQTEDQILLVSTLFGAIVGLVVSLQDKVFYHYRDHKALLNKYHDQEIVRGKDIAKILETGPAAFQAIISRLNLSQINSVSKFVKNRTILNQLNLPAPYLRTSTIDEHDQIDRESKILNRLYSSILHKKPSGKIIKKCQNIFGVLVYQAAIKDLLRRKITSQNRNLIFLFAANTL